MAASAGGIVAVDPEEGVCPALMTAARADAATNVGVTAVS